MLRSKCEIFFLEGEHGDVRHVVATITKENIRGGSEVTDSNRKDLKNHQSGDEEGTVHAGHLVAFVLGGKGGKNVHNVVNMAAALNQGPYKEAERQLVDYLIENPNAKVYLHVELNDGVNGFVDLRNPVNFRYKWIGVDGDTTTTYDSGVLKNTNTFVKNEYSKNQKFYGTSIASENQPPTSLPSPILTVADGKVSKIDSMSSVKSNPSQEIVSTPILSTNYNPDKAQAGTFGKSNLSPVKSPKNAPVKTAAPPTSKASSKNVYNFSFISFHLTF